MEQKKFSDMEFNEFIKYINDISGIDLSEKRNALDIKITSFLKEMNLQSIREFLNKIRYDKELRQKTLDFVTVNETYFYRELSQLKEAVYYIKSLNRPTSVLSAPCSSGEEVYSFAILAALNAVKDLHITGIDINRKMIQECKNASYEGRSLDRLGEAEKRRYFTNDEGSVYKVKKQELCRCRFELCNVFDDGFLRLGNFDVILSRNMMIYFDYESRVELMQRFHKIGNAGARFYAGNSDQIPDTPYFTKVFVPRGGSYYVRNEI
ncbi:chemotaxis protein CheR [Campylobacter sp. MIT 99-7217]|uniref:CheR family methyltransferase n=1 Tax=Campylobacter sp. MIT 99-7217 TaxID=535091 RepID=UPI00115A8B61|nr:protein-glutamate O-methyltransferase CheR [Campylobacter sp. MIT 99-7217]TQR34570.1 chemotaxis protein CheR [Campylobacter sp. MIT 99-7217]